MKKILLLVAITLIIVSCDGTNYIGRYEVCGFGVAAFYLDADGTCNNGKGSLNGGIYGKWEKTSNGIIISGMGSSYDGEYQLDGTSDGIALKRNNIRYCNPSFK